MNRFSFSGSRNTYVIAEIGSNHDGDFSKASEMIQAAAEAAVDAVKFQVYIPELLCHDSQEPAPILKGRYRSQRERFKGLVFTEAQYCELKEIADQVGVDFVATPFDLESATMLEPMVEFYKIASGDINNIPLVEHIIKTGKRIAVSVGMADLEEVDCLYNMIDHSRLTLLHCVSVYPAQTESLNLLTIPFLRERYSDVMIGYSDHHPGIRACLYAVILGARIIEKHFTFDKGIPYGDHGLSADFKDMSEMVQEIRDIEKMLGSKDFRKSAEELEKRTFFRRGLYAGRDLMPGEKLGMDNILLLRPPAEIGPEELSEVVDKTLRNALLKEQAISWDDLE